MSISLTDEQADAMAERIRGLMHHWHQNPMGSDYCCEFCGNTAETNRSPTIEHRPDCDGVRFLKILNP